MTSSISTPNNNFNTPFGLSREKVIGGLKNVISMGPKWVKNNPEISFAIYLISTIASSILICRLIKQKNQAISDLTQAKKDLANLDNKCSGLRKKNDTLETNMYKAAQMIKKAEIASLGDFKVKYEGEPELPEDSTPCAPAEVITVSIVPPEIRKWINDHPSLISRWEKQRKVD